jgi:cbb3-type cytochrome oxidase maturation protein
MDILFLLVPLSVLLALAVLSVLGWAVWSGQFEELESEGQRILSSAPATGVQEGAAAAAAEATPASLIHINTPDAAAKHTHA